MAVFVELVTDPFEAVFRSQASSRQGAGERSSRAGRPMARRPVRGIEIKEDTYAYLKVVLANGEALPLLDSSSPDGENTSGYTNFILQNVQEERMEKHQIVETFGESYIFFFGESPRFLNVQAQLINTHDFNWRAEWWHNYENYLRGTKLVELGARCYLFYDDVVVEGFIIGAQAQEVAEQPYLVTLSFRFFVTKYRNISLHNVQNFPLRSSAYIIEDPELTNLAAFEQSAAIYRESALGLRQQDALERQQEVVRDGFGNEVQEIPLPNANKISNAIAQNPAIAYSPDIWAELVGVVGLVDLDNPNQPISLQPRVRSPRGLIAENVDEYVSGADGGTSIVNEWMALNRSLTARRAAELSQTELDLLIYLVTINLLLVGCQVNDPFTVQNMGLGPNFSPGFQSSASAFATGGGGFGASAGGGFTGVAGASATASFSPISGFNASTGINTNSIAGFGVSASARAGTYGGYSLGSDAYAAAGGYQNGGIGYSSGYTSFNRDPLSSVFGAQAGASFSAGIDGISEGYGDLGYGYNSEFGGAGYGHAGYGTFGGGGYGSSLSGGDPGFKAIGKFSYGGIGSSNANYNKFTRPRQDNTAITQGPVLGSNSLSGGGSVHVGGSASAFAIVSVEGSIEPWASAEASANGGVLFFGPTSTADAYATGGIGL